MLVALLGCTENADEGVVLSDSSFLEVYSVVNQSVSLRFSANKSWRASCDASWLTLSDRSGSAGDQVLTLTTTSTNQTKAVRSAKVTITAGSAERVVTVRQRSDYALFDQDSYVVPAAGGVLAPTFKTNVDEGKLFALGSNLDWISMGETRAESSYQFTQMRVAPNTDRYAREAVFVVGMLGNAGEELLLDTLFVTQKGADGDYESTDFSADGQVEQLQQAAQGSGLNFVLMGDGFTDKDVSSGFYREVMTTTMDQLFSEQPVSSLRDYFNVYMVTAVSKTSSLSGEGSTAIGCVLDQQSSQIDYELATVNNYLSRIRDLEKEKTVAVVVVNSSMSRGCTELSATTDGSYSDFSVALCTLHDGVGTEQFRTVLIHEAVGHGFGQLADEYVNSLNGSASDEDLYRLKYEHRYEWSLNVDSESEPDKVLWSEMISDDSFSSESIGVYEGAHTFYKGMYRPTEESMMNQNDCPFNAPSRRVIYNKVMKRALNTTPTYGDFVEFDRAHKPTVWKYDVYTRSTRAADYRRLRKNSCIISRHSASSTPRLH